MGKGAKLVFWFFCFPTGGHLHWVELERYRGPLKVGNPTKLKGPNRNWMKTSGAASLGVWIPYVFRLGAVSDFGLPRKRCASVTVIRALLVRTTVRVTAVGADGKRQAQGGGPGKNKVIRVI